MIKQIKIFDILLKSLVTKKKKTDDEINIDG